MLRRAHSARAFDSLSLPPLVIFPRAEFEYAARPIRIQNFSVTVEHGTESVEFFARLRHSFADRFRFHH